MNTQITISAALLLLQLADGWGTNGSQYNDLYLLQELGLALDDDDATAEGKALAAELAQTPGGRELRAHYGGIDAECADWYIG